MKSAQTIELAGLGRQNKGAELMLIAALEHLHGANERVESVVSPWFGGFEDRAAYGLRCKLTSHRVGRSWLAAKLMPVGFRRAHGFVLEQEIEAVIDASGFAFGDQFGPGPTQRFAAASSLWKRQGKRIVMLPQALGPFTSEPIQTAFRTILQNVDLIFARDRQSLEHVRKLGERQDHVRLAPDFTNLVEPERVEAAPGLVCIVPNARMLEKPDAATRAQYLPFLTMAVSLVRERGLTPVLLLHEMHADEPLVEPLQASLGERIEVIRETDPRRLKGVIGGSRLVIGSRFHALVSALSQAVPAIATGWSHKYVELFRDYEWTEGVASLDADRQRLSALLDHCVAEPARGELVDRLKRCGEAQKQASRAMWQDVDRVLGFSKAGGNGHCH